MRINIRWLERALSVAHPPIFAGAAVVSQFTALNTSPNDLFRPLIVTVLGTTGLLVALRIFLPTQWAALVTSATVLWLLASGVPAAIVTAVALWWPLRALVRRSSRKPFPALAEPVPVARAMGIFSVCLLVAVGVPAAFAWQEAHAPARASPVVPTAGGGPSIYLLLLDGYPRADTLLTEFAFDNQAFLGELSRLDFEVASEARTNYDKTWLTVASMLHGEYVEDLMDMAEVPSEQAAQIRVARSLLDSGALVSYLRDREYSIVSLPSQITSTNVSTATDYRPSGHLTSFEMDLMTASLIGRVAPGVVMPILVDQVQSHVEAQIQAFGESPRSRSADHQLVLAHVVSPHPPLVFGPGGGAYLSDCMPSCGFWSTRPGDAGLTHAEYLRLFRAQLQHVNELTIEAVRSVVQADPTAVVIVMSDHGARHSDDADERFKSLFAARVPGHHQVFPNDVAPVNVFRRLLTHLFDEEMADLPYRAWASDAIFVLDLHRSE
jgi:hypothetical protein